MKVLIADDVLSARRVIRRMLEKLESVQVFEAKDGQSAYELLCGPEKFDLLISDLNLGDTTAIDLLQKLKQAGTEKMIPTIVMTSSGDRDSVAKAHAAGAATFMLKPFNLEMLREKVAEATRKSLMA